MSKALQNSQLYLRIQALFRVNNKYSMNDQKSYEILQIGEGSFGKVYRFSYNGTDYAVKKVSIVLIKFNMF